MIQKNFYNIYTNVGSNIQDTSTAMQTIIKRYVNDVYFDILRRVNWENINHDYSFTASVQDNVLPQDFYKEIAVYDATNKRIINRTTQANEIDGNVSNIASTGTVDRYAILDLPVRTQSFTAGQVSVVSSSASDTTQYLHIRGFLSTGVEVSENITLTGTSAATSTNTYSRITEISKSATTTGTVTATIGSTTIAVISATDIVHRVKIMRLYAVPASSILVNCPYYTKPSPMVSDYDSTVFECQDAIELGATARAWLYKRQNAKAADWNGLFEQAIARLIWDRSNQPNEPNYFTQGIYDRETI